MTGPPTPTFTAPSSLLPQSLLPLSLKLPSNWAPLRNHSNSSTISRTPNNLIPPPVLRNETPLLSASRSKLSSNTHYARTHHELMRLGIQWEAPSCNALLSGLGKEQDFQKMNLLMKEMKQKEIQPDVLTFGILINYLCKFHRVDEAMEVFERMRCGDESEGISVEPDIVLYNTLINGLCKVGRQEEGLEIMEKMNLQQGCKPNTVTYNSLIDGFCKVGEIEKSRELFDQMNKDGVEPNFITLNTLLDGMCKCGRVSSAMQFFNEMQEKGLIGNW